MLDRRYEGRHVARNYHSISTAGDLVLETSIGRNRLKSVVARITGGDGAYTIHGAAWGGSSPLRAVEVRIDTGQWQQAAMKSHEGRYAWTLWSLPWGGATPGAHTLVSRATDESGVVQPENSAGRALASSREDNSQWVRRIIIPSE